MAEIISKLRQVHQLKHSIPNKKCQSSVALILKPNSKSRIPFDILLLRRKGSSYDYYKRQICLPGGKIKKNQNYTEAAIRETFQETGIGLTQENFVIDFKEGFISFYVFNPDRTIKQPLRVHASVFYIESESKINLQQSEIQYHRWVPLDILVDMNTQKLHFQKIQKLGYLFLDNLGKVSLEKIKQVDDNFLALYMPSIDVDMNRQLFGLSMYIILYAITQIIPFMSQKIKNDPQFIKGFNKIIDHGMKFQSTYKQGYQNAQQAKNWVKQSFFKIIDFWPTHIPKL